MIPEKNKKSSKIQRLVDKQTASQRRKFSVQIETLMAHELKPKISFYLKRYSKMLNKQLGMAEEDTINELREVVWKGLLSYDKTKGANLKTYLHRSIENYFNDLHDKLVTIKHTSLDYFADVAKSGAVDPDHLQTNETGETIYFRREVLMKNLNCLSARDALICMDLVLGYTLETMAERTGLSVVDVTAAVNRINSKSRNNK